MAFDERTYRREYMRKRRAQAKADGRALSGDDWFKRNPEKHRQRVARWRAEHPRKARQIMLDAQARRRSTPWGKINNRMWTCVHGGVRADSGRLGKYNLVLGYTWADLRAHLQSQFTGRMSWKNWGAVWELDHIKPVASFRYETINCPTFFECWSLANLRPLLRDANRKRAHLRG